MIQQTCLVSYPLILWFGRLLDLWAQQIALSGYEEIEFTVARLGTWV